MAWEKWKDVWYPGKWTVTDPLTGEYRNVTYTAADLARGVENARGLLAKQYPIPLCWVHDKDNVPRPASQLAADIAARTRETFGQVKDIRLHPGGHVEALLSGDDDADLAQLAKVKFVSAQVHPGWTDPDEQRWEGSVLTHVAATARPIQYRQRPFQMSADPGPVWLSSFEGKDMATEDDAGTEDTTADACPPAIIDALRESGMTIPDEAKTVNEVVVAIKASQGGTMDDTTPTGTGTEAPPPPVTMSADAAGRVVAENARLKAQLAQAQGVALKSSRDQMKARIQAAFQSGRAGPADRDSWTRQLDGAVQLSADGTGKGAIPVQLAAEVAAHEKLPAGSIWSGERQTAARGGHEAELPADSLSEDEAEAKQADKDADDYAARRNRKTA